MRKGFDDNLSTLIVNAAPGKPLRKIRSHWTRLFQRIVNAVNERKILRPDAETDDLRVVFDQLVIRAALVVRPG